ncbi:hypothetical protein NFJ02_20g43100 [Pycnococcus provasolii]
MSAQHAVRILHKANTRRTQIPAQRRNPAQRR